MVNDLFAGTESGLARAPVWRNVDKRALEAGFGDWPGGRNEMAKTQHELKLVGELRLEAPFPVPRTVTSFPPNKFIRV